MFLYHIHLVCGEMSQTIVNERSNIFEVFDEIRSANAENQATEKQGLKKSKLKKLFYLYIKIHN